MIGISKRVGVLKYRNNKLIAVLIVIVTGMVIMVGSNLSIAEETMKNNKEGQVGNKIILIDAGHGGIDGGASSKDGTVEKDINLSIATKLKNSLQRIGYEVVMTREGAEPFSSGRTIRERYNEDLRKRCELKSSSNCVMFISIHLNHFSESKYYGAQVWYSSFKDSAMLAGITQNNLRVDLEPSNKRVQKPAKNLYKILRENDTMPSILVECGFLSNYEEEQRLKSDQYQQMIADSISKSIEEFYSKN
jgi:N-acetylmuramoyl-L-alanine amidase